MEIDWKNDLGESFEVESILISGFADIDADPVRARVYPVIAAICDGARYVVFEAPVGNGSVGVRVSRRLEMPGELLDEPSVSPFFIDISSVLLDEFVPVRVVKVEAFGGDESVGPSIYRITLENDREVVIDGYSSIGLNVGGQDLIASSFDSGERCGESDIRSPRVVYDAKF